MTLTQSRIIFIKSLKTTSPTSSGCSREKGTNAPLFFDHKVTSKQPSTKGSFCTSNTLPLVGAPYRTVDFYTDPSSSAFANWSDWAIAALIVITIVLEVAGVLA